MLVNQDINKLRFHSPTYTEGEDLTWKQYTMHIWHSFRGLAISTFTLQTRCNAAVTS